MGIVKKDVTVKTNEVKPKLAWANLGTIFPTKTGKEVFKGKFDKFGVKAIEVTLNSGEVYSLDADSFVLVAEKTIKTKNGEMNIKEVSLGY